MHDFIPRSHAILWTNSYVAIPRPLFNYVAIVPVTYTIEAVMLMNMLVPCMIFIVSDGSIYILNADMLSDCYKKLSR